MQRNVASGRSLLSRLRSVRAGVLAMLRSRARSSGLVLTAVVIVIAHTASRRGSECARGLRRFSTHFVSTQDSWTQLVPAIWKFARVVRSWRVRRVVCARLLPARQAADRLGRPRRPSSSWSPIW